VALTLPIPSGAEVKEKVKLYLSSPFAAAWHVMGIPLFYISQKFDVTVLPWRRRL